MNDDWQPGYPIDLRTPEQRVKASTNHVTPDFEYQVGRILARYTGVRIYLQDDNRTQKTPDARIVYGDGRVGHAEIWMELDRQLAEVAGVLSRQPPLTAPHLTRDWTVRVTSAFRLKRGKDTRWLPDLLGRLEAAGHVYEYVPRPDNLSVHPGPLADEARSLGIRGLSSAPARTGGPGRVEFSVWGIGGRPTCPGNRSTIGWTSI